MNTRVKLPRMIDLIPAPATLPPGQRVYVIGDIHGCLEQLRSLHDQIAEDMAARPAADTTLIHLGDYVDRGPDSAQVIARLAAGSPVPGTRMVNMMGNHEHMMLTALTSGHPGDGSLWLSNGGAEALLSWGVPRTVEQNQWATHIPLPHLVFLRDLARSHRIGPYFFVHAGIRPGVALDKQKQADLLWIREPFLSSRKDHGAVVVHGHTPVREPVAKPNRVCVDTGAVMGGKLTCAVLDGSQIGFIQA